MRPQFRTIRSPNIVIDISIVSRVVVVTDAIIYPGGRLRAREGENEDRSAIAKDMGVHDRTGLSFLSSSVHHKQTL